VTADLATLLAECGRLDPYLACSIGRDPTRDARLWLTAERLAADGSSLDRLADAYARRWEVEGDRASQATIIVLDYTWYATAPLVATWLVAGVVPSLHGAEVWLDPETREGQLGLGVTDAVPASTDALRATIEDHVAPLVDAIAERRWIGRRTAWMGVGDRVVGAIEHVERVLGTPELAPAEADRIVHCAGTALDSPRHRFVHVVPDGGGPSIPVGLRASCCRFYRVPGVEKCITCPLVPEPERDAMLRDWVRELAMEAVAAD
jgi:hypothetical protein